MSTTHDRGDVLPGARRVFDTTHWSVVLAAKEPNGSHAEAALEKLCQVYWAPLYAFLRREGHDVEDARDLTQEFFARLIEKRWLSHLRHREGKFRSFLLTLLKHFLSDQREWAMAQKRGGGLRLFSLEELEMEETSYTATIAGSTPEEVFDRRWAQEVFERATDLLREEYAAKGDTLLYDHLKDLQPCERGALTYAEFGARHGMSETAVKAAKRRLNRRHQDLLREVIANTVKDPTELESEIRHLIEVISR